MYGMSVKTTVYLPDDLKVAIEREAERLGVPEAEVIRSTLAQGLKRPVPNSGLFSAAPFAERSEDLLAGFGER